MNDHQIQLCLVLHNHQPVGNFDHVIEQAVQESYLPFLEVFEAYAPLRISLHISGPLLTWLEQRHPQYLDRITRLVAKERIEILGGAYYEPILTMIPRADRLGQIERFSKFLEQRFNTSVKGMWVPERVWEASLVADLADAGVAYTTLDDFHFLASGLPEHQLRGDFITEDQGRTLRVFPGSEKLRYTIPFQEPAVTIDYLRGIAHERPGCTMVFADDGEKFGSWPDTSKHVYEQGWLRRFFDALLENQSWLSTTTLHQSVQSAAPVGKVYLQSASYREMTEWALSVDRQDDLRGAREQLRDDWRWPKIKDFVHGGFWRNFKTKYSETNEMYARMMYVSCKLRQAQTDGGEAGLLEEARDHLYRGQCNCAYWHGAFGGVYLPHLRNGVYHHLIAADDLIDQAVGASGPFVETSAEDFNFDQRREIRLANEQIVCWLQPAYGGQLYELDVRSLKHNLLATMQRRPESYHEAVKRGQSTEANRTASIHDRVVFKQDNLQQMLIYDRSPRKSLVDHFWKPDASNDTISAGTATELGDFVEGVFQSTIRRSADRHQVLMTRDGSVDGQPIKITKGITLTSGESQLQIAYLLEGLPEDQNLHFGIEFNFSGMPDGQDDRFFQDPDGNSLGQLGQSLDLTDCRQLTLVDKWLGLQVELAWDQPGGAWAFPIRTVSQSEGGFELVHQSVVVQPHWQVRGDLNHRWATRMTLKLSEPLPNLVDSALEHVASRG